MERRGTDLTILQGSHQIHCYIQAAERSPLVSGDVCHQCFPSAGCFIPLHSLVCVSHPKELISKKVNVQTGRI
jgi:hypothetical protein